MRTSFAFTPALTGEPSPAAPESPRIVGAGGAVGSPPRQRQGPGALGSTAAPALGGDPELPAGWSPLGGSAKHAGGIGLPLGGAGLSAFQFGGEGEAAGEGAAGGDGPAAAADPFALGSPFGGFFQ
jgi:hypothetical protein